MPKPQLNATLYDKISDRLWLQILILFLLSFGFYFNTSFGSYALDDAIVITENNFTQKGFAGIYDLIANDTFLGFTKVQDLLTGGRYRPLSLVTFAIEFGLFGKNPFITHFINVLLYCITVILLFYFLRRFIFTQKPLLAFITALIFAIHPIHTEVVANIKSRDELMALLFLIISLYMLFLYNIEKRKVLYMALSLLFFFLSLLSKENAITFLAIIPLLFFYFRKKNIWDSLLTVVPFVFLIGLYFLLRIKITGIKGGVANEIMNFPFMNATLAEAFATKVYILGRYLKLLVFPHPLAFDYSFNQIPYVELTDYKFIIAFIINAALLAYAILNIKNRSLVSFGILYYFITISIVSNFVFDVGAPLCERFLFQPSIGFAMIVASGVLYFIEKTNYKSLLTRKKLATYGLLVVIMLCGIRTISRNMDWRSGNTLFIHDVKISPNSVTVNMGCAIALINTSTDEKDTSRQKYLLRQAVEHFNKALSIHPNFNDAYLNMGVAYSRLGDTEASEKCWLKAQQLYPGHQKLKEYFSVLGDQYFYMGVKANDNHEPDKAIEYYNKSLIYGGSHTADCYYNIGGSYMVKGDLKKAREYWEKTLQIAPDHADAKLWLGRINGNVALAKPGKKL